MPLKYDPKKAVRRQEAKDFQTTVIWKLVNHGREKRVLGCVLTSHLRSRISSPAMMVLLYWQSRDRIIITQGEHNTGSSRRRSINVMSCSCLCKVKFSITSHHKNEWRHTKEPNKIKVRQIERITLERWIESDPSCISVSDYTLSVVWCLFEGTQTLVF